MLYETDGPFCALHIMEAVTAQCSTVTDCRGWQLSIPAAQPTGGLSARAGRSTSQCPPLALASLRVWCMQFHFERNHSYLSISSLQDDRSPGLI